MKTNAIVAAHSPVEVDIALQGKLLNIFMCRLRPAHESGFWRRRRALRMSMGSLRPVRAALFDPKTAARSTTTCSIQALQKPWINPHIEAQFVRTQSRPARYGTEASPSPPVSPARRDPERGFAAHTIKNTRAADAAVLFSRPAKKTSLRRTGSMLRYQSVVEAKSRTGMHRAASRIPQAGYCPGSDCSCRCGRASWPARAGEHLWAR